MASFPRCRNRALSCLGGWWAARVAMPPVLHAHGSGSVLWRRQYHTMTHRFEASVAFYSAFYCICLESQVYGENIHVHSGMIVYQGARITKYLGILEDLWLLLIAPVGMEI